MNLENLSFYFSSCQQPSKGEMWSPSSTPLTPIRCHCSNTLRLCACGWKK